MMPTSSHGLRKWPVATAVLVAAVTMILVGSSRPALAAGIGPVVGPGVATASAIATQASGWIIGTPPDSGYGVILHTTNDGALWARQGSTSTIPATVLNNVKAVDRDTAWVVGDAPGDYGVVLRTTDAGKTWVRKGTAATIPNQNLYGVAPVGSDTAWVVGTNGTILRTDDAGDSWVQQPSGTTATLVEVAAVDDQTAWAVGDANSDWGVILHTTDGGATWQRQALLECDRPCIDLAVVDANTAWTVGSHGLVLKTTDGGAHWVSQMKYTEADNNGVCAVDANTAWIAADYSTMYRTDDGGSAWNMQNNATIPGGFYLLGVGALGSQTAWAVGGGDTFPSGGMIMHTTDAGVTWAQQPTPVNVTLRRLSMVKPPAPTAPESVVYTPVSGGGTRVRWVGSGGAATYSVYSGGSLIGTAGVSASSLVVTATLGPEAALTVVAQDSYGSVSASVAGVYRFAPPIQIGSVYFAPDSSQLSAVGRQNLRAIAALMKSQGFMSVNAVGYTGTRDHGSAACRKCLALWRAKSVKAYLVAESRRIHHPILVTVVGGGDASPAGPAATRNGSVALMLRHPE